MIFTIEITARWNAMVLTKMIESVTKKSRFYKKLEQ